MVQLGLDLVFAVQEVEDAYLDLRYMHGASPGSFEVGNPTLCLLACDSRCGL